MNNSEYIQFSYSDKMMIKDCKRVFNLINNCKQSKDKKTKAFWFKNVPDYVLTYFSELEKRENWSLINLIDFIINDLDVIFLGFSDEQDEFLKLHFESNRYPYGGPNSLIFFLRAFNCIAKQTDEGSNTYKIIWSSNFKFELKSIKSKETKGFKKIIKRLFKN